MLTELVKIYALFGFWLSCAHIFCDLIPRSAVVSSKMVLFMFFLFYMFNSLNERQQAIDTRNNFIKVSSIKAEINLDTFDKHSK